MEIKIEQKITVRIGEHSIEMTPDEARKLRDALDRALGKQADAVRDIEKMFPKIDDLFPLQPQFPKVPSYPYAPDPFERFRRGTLTADPIPATERTWLVDYANPQVTWGNT